MRAAAAVIGLVALAACASAPPSELPPPDLPQRAGTDSIVAARAEGIELQAIGEDFALDIFREDRIRLTLTQTGQVLELPKPEPQYPRWFGSIYMIEGVSRLVSIRIRDDRPCQNADRDLYPIIVQIHLNGRDLTGCGRRL